MLYKTEAETANMETDLFFQANGWPACKTIVRLLWNPKDSCGVRH
jgi:hypothetical protein